MKILLIVSILLAALYLCGLAALYVFQRNLVFAPSTERILPERAGFPRISEVVLETSSGWKLYSWYAQGPAGAPVLLFVHGNGGSVSTRGTQYEELRAAGFAVFMVGYPGYGGSEGESSEASLLEAAVLAYDYLRKQGFTSSDIVIYGESLGSAVAVQLATQRAAAALILVSPMSSARDIASAQYPFVPVRWLLKDPFLSSEHIRRVDVPLLVVHGDKDEAIPISSGRELFAAAREPKTFHVVSGGHHNDLYEFSIVPVLASFVESIRAAGLKQ